VQAPDPCLEVGIPESIHRLGESGGTVVGRPVVALGGELTPRECRARDRDQ
jgi:hypothetical protein